jgi:Arylsulfotransferase (ASST)
LYALLVCATPVLWSTDSVVSVQAAPGPGNEDGILVTGIVTSITSSPMPALQMSPPFMTSIHDYVIHCTSASNAITFTVGTAGGTTTVTRTLVENQPEIVQGSGAPYWIRCLPRDFPPITANETAAGVTAGLSGYYFTGSITTPAVPPWPVAYPTAYAMILDTNGTPVWYQPANYGSAVGATNVELLPNDTVAWSPLNGPGVGATPGVGYRLFNLDTQTTLPQPSPVQPPDLHELLQLPNGDRMELATPLVNCGTSAACPFGRSTFFPTVTNHSYVDCVVQEVGPSGNLVWSWDAKDHVDFMENKIQSALPIGVGGKLYADVYHCNSIDVDPSSHDVLISLRNTSAVYDVNRATGAIRWKLSANDVPGNRRGPDNEIVLTGPDTTISGQHDARFQGSSAPSGTDVSLFDDHTNCPPPPNSTCPPSGAARAVQYHIVYSPSAHTGTAALTWSYASPDGNPSAATGSFRRYAGNDNVIGWGFHGVSPLMMSEVNNDVPPKPLLTFSFPEGLYEYRFLKLQQLPFDINLLRQTAGVPHPSSAPRSVHFAKLDGAGSGSSAVEVSDSSIWLEKNLGNNTFGPPQLGATNGPFFGNVGTYLADLDGAGHASAVAVNTTDVWIEHDVGGDIFAQPMQAVGGAPFFGNVGTYVADLDGSGKASVIAVNTTDTWIEHNRGNDTFGPPQQVASGGRFFGSVGTYVADLDGTGKASLVAVNSNNIWIEHNLGNDTFGPPQQAAGAGPFFGGVGTYVADLDGHGKASVIAVNGNNVWVEKNQGNDTFGSPQSAGGSLFFGGVGTYVADIGVSGQASLLAVNSNSIWLENNQGNDTFGGPQPAAGNSPFYGTH